MKLDIVIPAYNEENAIGAIVQRCLDAREAIVAGTPVHRVTVTVVSDGSIDRTAEVAAEFEPDVRLIAYPENRGYGAAIKTGFAANDGDLVAFLDADGTCDPQFFVPLVNALIARHASLAIGSRMAPASKMPRVRRLGNRIWRMLINWIAQAEITDAASGMRVIRRDALPLLEPLPTGLHYTPTMSCRAALDERVSMVEQPIAYEERVGGSKLKVVRDGLRFLRTILDVGLTYQPFRLISLPGVFLLLLAVGLLLPLAVSYAATRHVADGEVYRVLTALVCAIGGMQMFLTGLEAERTVERTHPKKWKGGVVFLSLRLIVTQRMLVFYATALIGAALLLNLDGIRTWLSSGYVSQHWSRTAVGAMLVLLGFECLGAAVMERLHGLLAPPPYPTPAASPGAYPIAADAHDIGT